MVNILIIYVILFHPQIINIYIYLNIYINIKGDSNKTFLVGNVDANGRKLVNVTKESLKKAIAIGK